jgi:hypothetical protein
MKLPQSGGCQCGQVGYEITEEPQAVYTCHCLDCQRLTGSAFSLGIVVPEKAFRLKGIEPRRLQRTADSGHLWFARRAAPAFAEGWFSPPPGWHGRRYTLDVPHEAHMDSRQAALGQAPRGR